LPISCSNKTFSVWQPRPYQLLLYKNVQLAAPGKIKQKKVNK